jgi:hypothetical protein
MCASYGSMEGGDGLVIMTNGENFSIIEELSNSVARVYGWKDFFKPEFKKVIKLSTEEMDRFVGSFKLQTDTLIIARCGDGLCIRQAAQGEPGFIMLFTSADEFSITEVPSAVFKAVRNEQGLVETLEFRQNGLTIPCPRIKVQKSNHDR